jgi:dTMP kinase
MNPEERQEGAYFQPPRERYETMRRYLENLEGGGSGASAGDGSNAPAPKRRRPRRGATMSARTSDGVVYGTRTSDYPGRLFIVEGIDGSGKSTQLTLLAQWLRGLGYPVVFSEWNSSPIVRVTTKRGKKRKILTPHTFSLIHATDFSDRVEREIVPSLKAGAIVLADRYVYTAFARDVTRGVPERWVRSLYRFAVVPTLAFYFRVPLDLALKRILSGRPKLKWYEAGMDLDLDTDLEESYRQFQSRILEQYERLVIEYGLSVMDGTQPVELQQRALRQAIGPHLEGVRRLGESEASANGHERAEAQRVDPAGAAEAAS